MDAKPALLREFDQTPFWSRSDNFGNKSESTSSLPLLVIDGSMFDRLLVITAYNETMPHVTGFAPAGYVSTHAIRQYLPAIYMNDSDRLHGVAGLRACGLQGGGGQVQDALQPARLRRERVPTP